MDVCFQLHDESGTYCRHVGTSIYSLLKNTKQSVTIHFLCDDTLTPENRSLLKKMVEKDFGQNIIFYNVKVDELLHTLDREGRWYYSIATFYRLYLIRLLPNTVERIICFDADLIIHLDIAELWNEDFECNAVIAVQDSHIQTMYHPLCEEGILKRNRYFNAGVLYFNCKLIREQMDMVADSLQFINQYYDGISCGDQDALNNIFADRCKYVNKKFNISVKKEREMKKNKIFPAIYHYLNRTYMYNLDDSYGKLYYEYFFSTPWGDGTFSRKCFFHTYLQSIDLLCIYNTMLKTAYKARYKKIVYWGASSKQLHSFLKRFPLMVGDCCVDNDSKLTGQKIFDMEIKLPQDLFKNKRRDIIIIVMSKYHYPTIRKQLLEYGYREYLDFIPACAFDLDYANKMLGDKCNMDRIK